MPQLCLGPATDISLVTDASSYDYFGSPEQPPPAPAGPDELNRFGLPVGAGMPPAPASETPKVPSLQPHELAQIMHADPSGLARSMRGSAYPTRGRLGFRRSVSAGLDLTRTTLRILRRQPELLTVTFICLLAAVIVCLTYAQFFGGLDELVSGGRVAIAVRTFPLLALTSIIGTMGAAVVVGATTMIFEEGRGSLTRAWSHALTHLPQLVAWGLVSAAERTLTGLLRQHRLSSVFANLIDVAWDFATYLAVPIILYEDGVGPFQAVKRSSILVRGRWGAQAVAEGAITLALLVCAIPLFVLAIVIAVKISLILGLIAFVVVYVAAVVLGATLGGILSAAMYRFASTGFTSDGFFERDLWAAFGGQPFGRVAA